MLASREAITESAQLGRPEVVRGWPMRAQDLPLSPGEMAPETNGASQRVLDRGSAFPRARCLGQEETYSSLHMTRLIVLSRNYGFEVELRSSHTIE